MEKLDPWGSNTITNYEKAFEEFGVQKLSNNLKLDHHLFKRNIILAHRDFDKIIKRIKEKKSFIQMTGIASSGKLHLGHKIDIDLFVFFKKYNSKNYFGICDIDGYVSRDKIKSLEEAKKYAVENLAHALALGVDKKDISLQSKKEPRYYEFAFELSKKITKNMFEAVYGHLNLGKVSANLLQYADILHPQLKEYEGKMPSLTSIGLDQDPHAKLTRDLSRRLGYNLEVPSFLYFKHQSGLLKDKKMSASEQDTAIFLDDSESEIKRKINKSFTGGKDTLKEQKEKGGNLSICKVYEILMFHDPSDANSKKVARLCKAGAPCKDCKDVCTDFLTKMLKKHQSKLKTTRKIAEKMVFNRKI